MIVFIPGATGGGPYITKLRLWLHTIFSENILILSSVSTKYGFKPNESLNQRYQRLSAEIRLGINKELVIISHSLGVLEIPYLLDNLKVIPKRIILISPPMLNLWWLLGYFKLALFPAFYEPIIMKDNHGFFKRLIISLKVHKYIQDEYHGMLVSDSNHKMMLEKYSEDKG